MPQQIDSAHPNRGILHRLLADRRIHPRIASRVRPCWRVARSFESIYKQNERPARAGYREAVKLVAHEPSIDFPELITERLLLRRIRRVDARDLMAVFCDEDVARFLDGPTLQSEDEVLDIVAWAGEIFAAGSGLRWGIALQGEKRLIGTCGFHAWSKPNARAEMGYDLAHAYWRRGIMSEALWAITRYGFNVMGLNRIEAHVLPANAASLGILGKLGFRSEGILREYEFYRDRFNDTQILSLLKNDFARGSS